MKLPVWLVCYQELRTSLRVRRVFDFISNALTGAVKNGSLVLYFLI